MRVYRARGEGVCTRCGSAWKGGDYVVTDGSERTHGACWLDRKQLVRVWNRRLMGHAQPDNTLPGSFESGKRRDSAVGGMERLTDEDAYLRSSLAALGYDALRQLQDVLTWPEPSRDALLRSLVGRPELEPLAQLIAMTQTRWRVRRGSPLWPFKGESAMSGRPGPLVLTRRCASE